MPIEIERKFLVKGDRWRSLATGSRYCQGYIVTGPKTVRVRVVGNQGYLTIKGPSVGFSRSEYEYPIPIQDALEMLHSLCEPPLIEKTRYRIEVDGVIWEIDEFEGENKGLLLAEVELTNENQTITLPDWIGKEVSGDPRYYNANLAKNPFSQWRKGIKD
ncbi:CYTH domain-containing protein [Leptothermofonsia sp. ETS-13]|uniref:CYTH domain-containing protein n=1 Tax=Leptothermofonsia sp. ETS-13 TaxID=3035696 RepID=UPI003BA12854